MPSYVASLRERGQADKALRIRNKERKKYYNKYNYGEIGKINQYVIDELDLILSNPFENDRELAQYLNRSVQGIQIKRSRLRKKEEENV